VIALVDFDDRRPDSSVQCLQTWAAFGQTLLGPLLPTSVKLTVVKVPTVIGSFWSKTNVIG